jgi:hypothetical protein
MPSDTPQTSDLTHLYSTYGDTELLSVAFTYSDLTDSAQQALKSELARRGLSIPGPDAPKPQPEPNAPECVFEFNELENAYLAQSILRSAGIESMVPSSEISAIDTPRLIVAPDDANAAQRILTSARLVASEAGSDGPDAFVEPTCPNCGAPDPLLESVEPTNQWRCEACNHLWSDPEPADD